MLTVQKHCGIISHAPQSTGELLLVLRGRVIAWKTFAPLLVAVYTARLA